MNAFKFILDWDGTMFVVDQPISGSTELFRFLCDDIDSTIWYVTNNSSRNYSQYRQMLKSNNLWKDENCEIITSSIVTIEYLVSSLKIKRAFILGNRFLKDELRQAGIKHSSMNAQAVVVGFDTTFTFKKIQIAHELISLGLPFIATHDDKVCPKALGSIVDCGSIIEMLKTSSGVAPFIIGKPHATTATYLKSKIGMGDNQSCFFIGDRVESDGKIAKLLNFEFIDITEYKSLIDVKLYIEKRISYGTK